MSSPELVIRPDADAAAREVAARLRQVIPAGRAAGRPLEVGLTGGSMGTAAVAAWVEDHQRDPYDLDGVAIWWGDERFLPAGDPDRNDTQADDAGLTRLGLDPATVHRVLGPESSPDVESAAQDYAHQIREHGRGGFEVLMLGVGPDGHVASLFPGHPAQLTQDAITVGVHGSPKPPPERVSLTLEAMERVAQVWFVVAGADKAEAVRDALAGAGPSTSTAAQVTGQRATVWFLDEAAASLIDPDGATPV